MPRLQNREFSCPCLLSPNQAQIISPRLGSIQSGFTKQIRAVVTLQDWTGHGKNGGPTVANADRGIKSGKKIVPFKLGRTIAVFGKRLQHSGFIQIGDYQQRNHENVSLEIQQRR